MNTIKGWWYIKRLEWRYERDYAAPDSLYALWDSIKHWWKNRPQLVECASMCGQRLWHNGPQNKKYNPAFCSEQCTYYGVDAWADKPKDEISEDEIPF